MLEILQRIFRRKDTGYKFRTSLKKEGDYQIKTLEITDKFIKFAILSKQGLDKKTKTMVFQKSKKERAYCLPRKKFDANIPSNPNLLIILHKDFGIPKIFLYSI